MPVPPVPSLRLPLLLACTLAATATAAPAQSRDRWREADERARRERIARERAEEARERARERARADARRAAEQRQRVLEQRLQERERALREAARRRQDGWGDSYRPRVSLGGGLDVREFGGQDDRYVVQAGVDFRTRSGLGVRPELLFGWTEAATQPARGRSRILGVAVNGTYTLARSSPVRPYLLSGLGVFSTRSPQTSAALVNPVPPSLAAQQATSFRNDIDVGLTAGAGLEFDLGPVRLFGEFRYLLTDQPRANGFGGMLPLTAGLRL
jgi:opacity protein-like surface antigen